MPDFDDRTSSNHLFPILVEKRDQLVSMLKERGIGTGVHYRRNDAYPMYPATELPGVQWFSDHVMSLPMHMYLSDEDVAFVSDSIASGW